MSQYLPIVLLALLASIFGLLSRMASKMLTRKRPNASKLAPYECGIVPTKETPQRFPVSFYLVAMLFIMFDIEIVFLYPFAVSQGTLGSYGFWAILLFSAVFFLSFVYEVAKGGLDWGPLHKARRLTDMVSAERTASTTVRRVGLEGRTDVPIEVGEEEAA